MKPDDIVEGSVPGAEIEEVLAPAFRCTLCAQTDQSKQAMENHLWIKHAASRDPYLTCQAWSPHGGADAWCVRPLGHEEVDGDAGHWTPNHQDGVWWQGPRGKLGAGRGKPGWLLTPRS